NGAVRARRAPTRLSERMRRAFAGMWGLRPDGPTRRAPWYWPAAPFRFSKRTSDCKKPPSARGNTTRRHQKRNFVKQITSAAKKLSLY
ncbi:MAG: hypothetical protein VX622_14470, partial [Pseudomonadota bacterium]|nr:hypothetical protein [Pseudomonadota bacterium]